MFSLDPAVFTSRATISLGALEQNLTRVRAHLTGQKIMAVIKGDAYGHGLLPAARAFARPGADYLGVAQVAEALALVREWGEQPTEGEALAGHPALPPVFSWIYTPDSDLAPALEAGIELSVGDTWMIEAVARAAQATGHTARVHLSVDSGMTREGFNLEDIPAAAQLLATHQQAGRLEVVGIWSHLACADDPDSDATTSQIAVFDEARRLATRASLTPRLAHLSASSGVLWHPGARYDMVRPGIILYGLSPEPRRTLASDLGLRPAMRLESELLTTRQLSHRAGVSYGHTAVVEDGAVLGVVPLGYADGVPRALSNKGYVTVGEGPAAQRAPITGRVCMDQFVVRLDGPLPAGTPVVLFGDPARGEVSAAQWALASGTISYEIITRVAARVPRLYVK
ncbi:alanine racemase [Actinotignum sp. GS-2025e]|uniref:alanine racemase n=2 Tax=Actinotignum TaxID=1653174 RepID=UPI003F44F8D7